MVPTVLSNLNIHHNQEWYMKKTASMTIADVFKVVGKIEESKSASEDPHNKTQMYSTWNNRPNEDVHSQGMCLKTRRSFKQHKHGKLWDIFWTHKGETINSGYVDEESEKFLEFLPHDGINSVINK